jgi:tetraacyldisaccharide 4'-kinase
MQLFFRILLWPLAVLYDAITRFRNHLYNIEYKRSFQFETNVVNVGNLSVGGSGKTPMVEYLIKMLSQKYRVATLSRGYGRKTRGFRIANPQDSASTLGDEPYQFFLKFHPRILVTVGEERAMAIPEILHSFDAEVILLDDAFQHRKVRPQVNILLTEYQQPFYRDWVLPAGRLREARIGAHRADIVVVTKCPQDMSDSYKEAMKMGISSYTRPQTPVFFAGIDYCAPIPLNEGTSPADRVFLFSGIAKPQPLVEYVAGVFQLEGFKSFPDHHPYSEEDISSILEAYGKIPGENKMLLTTEKDWVKLLSPPIRLRLSGIPVYYLPIEIRFLDQGADFDKIILDSIRTYGIS